MPVITAREDVAATLGSLGARIRVLRRKRQLSLDSLANQSGMNKSYLSRIERGLKSPSLAVLVRLSTALGVTVGELLGNDIDLADIQVLRAADRVTVSTTRGGDPYLVAMGIKSRAIDSFLMYPQEQYQLIGHGSIHTGEECIFVQSGKVEIAFNKHLVQLSEGECVHFPGTIPHKIRRIGGEPAIALVIVVHGDYSERLDDRR